MKGTSMEINQLVKQCYDAAVAKGWHEKPRSALECHMLMVTEIAEASEAVRNNEPAFYFATEHGQVLPSDLGGAMNMKVGDTPAKPEGEATELADAVIRICDYFGKKGWDLEAVIKAKMEFNATRPHRHGGKAL